MAHLKAKYKRTVVFQGPFWGNFALMGSNTRGCRDARALIACIGPAYSTLLSIARQFCHTPSASFVVSTSLLERFVFFSRCRRKHMVPFFPVATGNALDDILLPSKT